MATTETGSQENGSTLPKPTYKRVMLKISGEALMGDQGFGLHPPTVQRIANEVKSVHDLGVEICMVIGGGNIFRGLQGSAQGMERTTADYMGMLATVMNALGMQSALEELGVFTRVISAIPMDQVCEPYIRRRAVRLRVLPHALVRRDVAPLQRAVAADAEHALAVRREAHVPARALVRLARRRLRRLLAVAVEELELAGDERDGEETPRRVPVEGEADGVVEVVLLEGVFLERSHGFCEQERWRTERGELRSTRRRLYFSNKQSAPHGMKWSLPVLGLR